MAYATSKLFICVLDSLRMGNVMPFDFSAILTCRLGEWWEWLACGAS
jgi:hypothetical protein